MRQTSILTFKDLLLLSDKSKVKRMKRKISRKIEYGDGSDSFVTVTESTLSDENRSILSDFSELDSELRDRLNRLKKNLGRERKAFKDASNQVIGYEKYGDAGPGSLWIPGLTLYFL